MNTFGFFLLTILGCEGLRLFPDRHGNYIFDDMILDQNQYDHARGLVSSKSSSSGFNSGIADDRKRWKNRVLPYRFGESIEFNDRLVIKRALARMNQQLYPCIYIRPAREGDSDYVKVVKENGCESYVGRSGGEQKLSLGYGCYSMRTIMHEFTHALGFYHEQSRPDRDLYVNINFNNIRDDYDYNFQKHEGSLTYDVPYDAKSVMHYSSKAFTKDNNLYTITSKIPGIMNSELGSADELTSMDVRKLKEMYNCIAPPLPEIQCPTSGCPVQDIRTAEIIGKASKSCVFLCSSVKQGDYRYSGPDTGMTCFDSDLMVNQYRFCCKSGSVPGGIRKC